MTSSLATRQLFPQLIKHGNFIEVISVEINYDRPTDKERQSPLVEYTDKDSYIKKTKTVRLHKIVLYYYIHKMNPSKKTSLSREITIRIGTFMIIY